MSFVPYVMFGLFGLIMTVRSQSLANCPDGWTRFHDSCYYVGYEQRLNFVEAVHFCQQHHGHLINIDTALENAFIKDLLKKTHATGYVWLGLTDMNIEGVWQWYSNDEIAKYLDWFPGEPDGQSKHANEDCADFEEPLYMWHDVPCSRTRHPLCEINMNDEVTGTVG